MIEVSTRPFTRYEDYARDKAQQPPGPTRKPKFREASQPLYENVDMPEGAFEAWKEAVGR